MIPLSRPCLGAEEAEAVREVLESGWVAQGPTTGELECEFAGLVGVPYAIATSSCTTALHLAIAGLGITEGDEVILPSYTFPATANAVLYERATPILVDMERESLNIDPARVLEAITKKTKAVIGVHLFGCPCRMDDLRAICDEHDLILIEDAACAVGTEIGGRQAGSLGNVACFSFHGRKVVTCGEGGMLTTRDEALAERLRSLRTHGADRMAEARHASSATGGDLQYVRLGYNYRISDIQAAIARVQLRKLPGFLTEREDLAKRYDKAFADLPLRVPRRAQGERHSYQSYVVVLEESAGDPVKFREVLADAGVSTRIGTYAIHREPYFPKELLRHELPASDEAALRSVALPLFNGLDPDDQDKVIEAVAAALGSSPEHSRIR